jgi:tetratricopeptide (TPR) repeat protein
VKDLPLHSGSTSEVGPLLAKARDHRDQLNLIEASRTCRAALAIDPGAEAGLFLLGSIAGEAGETAASVRFFRRFTSLTLGDADGHANLGSALLESGAHTPALAAMRRALALRPAHQGVLYNWALAHQRAAERIVAASIYRRALAVQADNFEARRNLAVTLQLDGKLDEAIDRFRNLIAEAPHRHDVQHNLAIALLDAGRTLEAAEVFRETAHRRFAVDGEPFALESPWSQVTPVKLKHDLEQLDHLIQLELAPKTMTILRDQYRRMLEAVDRHVAPAQPLEVVGDDVAMIEKWYGRHYARTDPPIEPSGAINATIDWAAVEMSYLEGRPEIVTVDDFLTSNALAALRVFCLESSLWGRTYGGGYLGSFMEDGFICPLLAQIADELRQRLPGILSPHPLKKLWGFKYDSRLSGINLHADFAAVNVNFWITPDAANTDRSSGGLVIWDKGAPASWSFADYNRSPDRGRAFLDQAGARPVVVPYRMNRAVIFNSNLFHETDRFAFQDDYASRRINITLLYGLRD